METRSSYILPPFFRQFNLYRNRNVFPLSKSVLVLNAFRYEDILSSGGHLAFSKKMYPQLLGLGSPAIDNVNVSSAGRERVI